MKVATALLTVLQVIPALESGGVEKGTVEIARALTARGHRSVVMSGGGRLVQELLASGSEHHDWAIGRKSLWSLRLIPRLRAFLEEQRVDILHVRSRMPAWLAYLAWRGMPPSTRPRLLTTVHGYYSVNPYSAIMTKGERIIAVSNSVRDYVLNHYPSTEPDRLAVIHRGIDRSRYPSGYRPSDQWISSWRREHPYLQDRYILTLPGRITRLKGHEDFLHIMRTLLLRGVPVHGLIVGEPSPRRQAYASEIKHQVHRMELDEYITFTGHRNDLREIMAVSDVVFSLSTSPESFGRTTLEALSLGRPVIGYDHGGVGEQLSTLYPEGKAALGDRDAVQRKVLSWWKDGAPPAPTAIPYTLDNMCQKTISLYEELASAPR